MEEKYSFGPYDYVVIALSLLVSAGIGVWFRFTGDRQKTPEEYLLGGKSMSKIPVIFSFAVTIMSAVSMLGAPAEVYRYGAGPFMSYVPTALGMIAATYIILPVYFKNGVSSIYEYLEIRYGKITRYTVSAVFIVQMVLYMSAVLYGPALALSAVTNLSMETSIVVFAVVCTFYCSIGGLKAVLWTDVFQAFLMFASLGTIYTMAFIEVGGIAETIHRAKEGSRLNIIKLNPDLVTRQTVWNVGTMGFVMGLGSYGTNQLQVQRLLSLSTLKRAQSAFLWSILPVLLLVFLCDFLGVLLYAVFYTCDPISNSKISGVTKYDQLVPYFAVSRLHTMPSLAGLCVAGIFSGSLSTISSAINSLSTVTVIDYVQPFFKLSQRNLVFLAKGFAILYGMCCIGFAFVLSRTDSLLHATLVSLSAAEGPICALFVVGMLTSKPTQRDALIGLLIGCSISSFIGYGSLFSNYRYPILPLDVSGCSVGDEPIYNSTCHFSTNCTTSSTSPNANDNGEDTFFLFKTSFMWLHAIGSSCTAFSIIIPSIIRGVKNRISKKSYMPPISITFLSNKKKTEVINKFGDHANGKPITVAEAALNHKNIDL